MVSFRFHIVSIIAVFLALALGIGMGVTVIDKATVDLLQRRLDSVQGQVQAANQRSDILQQELSRTEGFDDAAADYLTGSRLNDTPVTIVAVRGTDAGIHNDVRQALTEAGATVQGTLWFTEKANLAEQSDAAALQRILDAPDADTNALRQAMLARVSAVLAGASTGSQLSALVGGGFLDWDAASASRDVAQVAFGAGRIVELLSPAAVVPNDQIATPLARLLAAQPARRLVAAEIGKPAAEGQAEQRAVVLAALRQDTALNDRLSTVDNVDSNRGRAAMVLALAELAQGRSGDYGVAPSAESPLPRLQQ